MIVTLYMDWGDEWSRLMLPTAAAWASPAPQVDLPEAGPLTRWRIDLDTQTGQVSARKATLEERAGSVR